MIRYWGSMRRVQVSVDEEIRRANKYNLAYRLYKAAQARVDAAYARYYR